MTRRTRAFVSIGWELDELLPKSVPYALSSREYGRTTFLHFVKGLVLSTNIIEVIDKHIPNGYRADWGHVIDVQDGDLLSKECDIIIYEGKPYKLIQNKRTRFVLVAKERVNVVIQVRSSIRTVTKDLVSYCKELKKFVHEVWFIAECCWANTEKRADIIKQALKNAGYDQVFYFYREDPNSSGRTIVYEPFVEFISLIERIK